MGFNFFFIPKHCFSLFQILYSFLQLVLLLYSSLIIAVEDLENVSCGKTNLTDFEGTIRSPNNLNICQKDINCEWKIYSPENSEVTLTIVELDLKRDHPCHRQHCCSNQWLLVPKKGGSEFLCESNSTARRIIVSQPVISIKYFASCNSNGRGFVITYSINLEQCKHNEFKCPNGKCISAEKKCNKNDDCEGGLDEQNCTDTAHPSKTELIPRKIQDSNFHQTDSSKMCSNGKRPCEMSPHHCYLPTNKCDGKFQCPNGEDEVGCSPECPNQIACSSSGCYSPSQRCNYKRNCRDNSDETGCPPEPCMALQFTCLNGACVPGTAICNGDDDCGDLSDEENCAKSSFMTAAIMGLLSCIFLFCIGLSCLYRVYAARLRASAAFANQLEPESIDDEFIYREPPPAYSVAVGDAALIPYSAPGFMERYFEPEQSSRQNRPRNLRLNRRRHRSSLSLEQSSTMRSRPRPSSGFAGTGNSNTHFPESQLHPKGVCTNKTEAASSRANFEGVIELLGFPDTFTESQSSTQINAFQNSYQNDSPCSSPSLSLSRESVTSSTSLDDHEDLTRSCHS